MRKERETPERRAVRLTLRRVVATGKEETLPCGCVIRKSTVKEGDVNVSLCKYHTRNMPLSWLAQAEGLRRDDGAHRREGQQG